MTEYVWTLYERRWHGFARWQLELWEHHKGFAIATPIASGWTRRTTNDGVICLKGQAA